MNKMQLIEAVAKELGVAVPQAARNVDAVLDAIVRAVVNGESVGVTGLGTFETVSHPARKVRNPQTGGSVALAARTRPRFRPGQNFKDLVNKDKQLPAGRSAVAKAPKGSLVPAEVKAARLEADRKAAELTIASRRVAGQAGAR
jgi:DNA-binding protein HU-beta